MQYLDTETASESIGSGTEQALDVVITGKRLLPINLSITSDTSLTSEDQNVFLEAYREVEKNIPWWNKKWRLQPGPCIERALREDFDFRQANIKGSSDIIISRANAFGRTLGFVIFKIDKKVAFIHTMAVLPEYARCGLGAQLLSMLNASQAHNAVKIAALSNRKNMASNAFLEKYSFQISKKPTQYFNQEHWNLTENIVYTVAWRDVLSRFLGQIQNMQNFYLYRGHPYMTKLIRVPDVGESVNLTPSVLFAPPERVEYFVTELKHFEVREGNSKGIHCIKFLANTNDF